MSVQGSLLTLAVATTVASGNTPIHESYSVPKLNPEGAEKSGHAQQRKEGKKEGRKDGAKQDGQEGRSQSQSTTMMNADAETETELTASQMSLLFATMPSSVGSSAIHKTLPPASGRMVKPGSFGDDSGENIVYLESFFLVKCNSSASYEF